MCSPWGFSFRMIFFAACKGECRRNGAVTNGLPDVFWLKHRPQSSSNSRRSWGQLLNFSLPASISQILGLQVRPAAPCSSGDGTQGMLHGWQALYQLPSEFLFLNKEKQMSLNMGQGSHSMWPSAVRISSSKAGGWAHHLICIEGWAAQFTFIFSLLAYRGIAHILGQYNR